MYVYKEGMSEKEQKDGAYWERNMLALHFAIYANQAYKQYKDYLKMVGSTANAPDSLPCGWYYDTDNNWDGWKRVISLFDGRSCFHIPDDFDLGNRLPQIEPNWNGHSTEDKWTRVMKLCGVNPDNK